MANISNIDDVIDSRDVIARIEELEADLPTLDDDDKAELAALLDLAQEGENYAPDWQYGETLVRDSYFQDYAEQLADDLGLVNKEVSWPYTCIDWEQAATDLRMDYTSIDFAGVTYWVR